MNSVLRRGWLAAFLGLLLAVPLTPTTPASAAPRQPVPAKTAPQPHNADGHPGDAARHPRVAGPSAVAPGQTAMIFDQDKRSVKLRIDEGYDLDQFRFASAGPTNVGLDLHGLNPAPPPGGGPLALTLRVFDVDQAGSEECAPEIDVVTVNGTSVGTLSGANEQWSINSFALPAGALTSGLNNLQVVIDTGGTGCWGVTVDYAEVELPLNIGETEATATDDVTIRRGLSNDTIPDKVYASGFDAAGNPTPPSVNDPIADSMRDSGWLGSSGGKFTYHYKVDAWPARGTKAPDVTASYQFTGTSTPIHTEPVHNGWEGEFEVVVPQVSGKHRLVVQLEIAIDGNKLLTDRREHEFYILLGAPVSDTFFGGGVRTEEPKTAWLDRAFQWGAADTNLPRDALEKLTAGIYANPLGWTYVARPPGPGIDLLEGRSTKGDCYRFRDVEALLAWSIGIDVSTDEYFNDYLTRDKKALDGNASANVSRSGGAAGERWLFGSHAFVTFDGRRYDPTFGIVGDDSTAEFERQGVYCILTGTGGPAGAECELTDSPGTKATVRPLGSRNASDWPLFEYSPPAPLAPRQTRALASTVTFGTPTDQGADLDGNGSFDFLRVDVPATASAAGTYTVFATLGSGTGGFLASGSLDTAVSPTPLATATLAAGANTLTLWFRGRDLRAHGVSGPYTLTLTVYDSAGGTAGTLARSTAAYQATAFQGPLAQIGTVTDAAVDTDGQPGADQLRVSVPLTALAAGQVHLQARLVAGGSTLRRLERDVTLTAGTSTQNLDFPAALLWAAGIDGPYRVDISVRDAGQQVGLRHVTAAYRVADFQPPVARVVGPVTDRAGADSDGDGRSDSLDVAASVVADALGAYPVVGRLLAADGTVLASTRFTATATTTPSPVVLHFDGRTIARSGVDGPYEAVLTTVDAAGAIRAGLTHRTAAYRADEFQAPEASLSGYADQAVDTSGDGSPDVLRVAVTVEVATAGDYTLGGTLYDPAGKPVGTATATATLGTGPAQLQLDFEGAGIQAHAVDGPYRLSGVRLDLAGTGTVDAALDAHTTAAYQAGQFRPRGAFFVDSVTDRTVDLDGDGSFDQLVVDVGVVVSAAGTYFANARLVDAAGGEILWSGTVDLLQAGAQTMSIPYDGRRIFGHGADGPYQVADLSVYSDPATPVTIKDAHRTAAYHAGQFEASALVTGHVTVAGRPLAGAVVAVGGIASDTTRADGGYRLSIPESGTYEVSITADPVLAPWRITVDGSAQAPGTGAQVTVNVGTPVTVDFASGVRDVAFHPLPGTLIADTVTGLGVPARRLGPAGLDVLVAGQGGVPASGVGAVALRVLTADPVNFGSLAVTATGAARPTVADTMLVPHRVATALVLTPLGADGKVHLHGTAAWPNVAVAPVGWFPATDQATGGYLPVPQTTLLDTTQGRHPPITSVDVPVTGRAGIPATGVGAVVLKVNAVRPAGAGAATLYPTGQPRPGTPSVSYDRLTAAANLVVTPVGTGGKVRLTRTGLPAEFAVSVVGWFPDRSASTAAGQFLPLPGTPVADTRTGLGLPRGQLAPNSQVEVRVGGLAGVPAGAGSVVLEILATNGSGVGAVRLYPAGSTPGALADVPVHRAGQTSSLAVVQVGPDGRVAIATGAARTDLVLAVLGWLPAG